MTASIFFDTNVLVYTALGGRKNERTRQTRQLVDHRFVCIAIER